MTDWRSITVEEGETERIHCECCTDITTQAIGNLFKGSDFIGWYSATFASDRDKHPPKIMIYVGDWTEAGKPNARWGMNIIWQADGCMLLDWEPDQLAEINAFTPLGRDDILNTQFASDMWAMTDAIIMKDSRLEGLHAQ